MPQRRAQLVLQALGPDATLLRLGADAGEVGQLHAEVLGVFRAAGRGRDVAALADESVLRGLTQSVRENGLAGREVVLLLGGSSVACHRFSLPQLDRDAAPKAIRLKLANLLPYEAAKAALAIDPPATRERDGAREHHYRVSSAPADAIRTACQAVQNAGLIVRDVVPAPAAIESLVVARLANHDAEPVAAAFIGESATTLVVCHRGDVLAVNELPPALADLTAALMRPIIAAERSIELPEAEARALRDAIGVPLNGEIVKPMGIPADRVLPLLEPVLQQWARSLTQWITFASTSDPKAAIRAIWIMGPGAAVPGLARSLNGRLPVGVEQADLGAAPLSDSSSPALTNVAKGGVVAAEQSSSPVQRAALEVAIHAAQRRFDLPSLLPLALRRTRQVAFGVRVASVCGTAIAVAFVLVTAALWRMGGGLATTLAANEAVFDRTRVHLAELQRAAEEHRRIERLRADMETFSRCTPPWSGAIKELARLLPPHVVLRRVQAERKGDIVTLLVTARVFTDPAVGGFDRVVQAPLRALQSSPYFEAIEVVSAQQPVAAAAGAEAGELRLKMNLVFTTTIQSGASRPPSGRPQ